MSGQIQHTAAAANNSSYVKHYCRLTLLRKTTLITRINYLRFETLFQHNCSGTAAPKTKAWRVSERGVFTFSRFRRISCFRDLQVYLESVVFAQGLGT